jgi:thiol-disulfide isomerase/thioredoxin
MYSPIYEGDFSNQSKHVRLTGELLTEKPTLVVITIPNCPFCLGSIQRMKILKKRNPAIQIRYIVCATDTEALTTYKKESGGFFPVELAKDPAKMEQTANYAFPTFILIKKGQSRSWSNDSFGVLALDEVEKSFD